MVEALAKVELQSSENIIQIGNALAMVLSSPEEVTKKNGGNLDNHATVKRLNVR